MASDPMSVWQPNWAVPPGEILLEALQDRGMTQSELAQRTARPLKTINEIIRGKAAITAETAIQLERALGISARFWTGLEATYRNSLAQQEAQRELEANASWLDGFPNRRPCSSTTDRTRLIQGGDARQPSVIPGPQQPCSL